MSHNLVLVSTWAVLSALAALFLWWSRRAELASAGGLLHAFERRDLAFSTGGDAGPPGLTEAQREVLRALCSPEIQEELLDWLRRLGIPRQDRMDLAQTIMLKAIGSVHTFDRSKGTPRRWLNGICVHVAAHHRKLVRHEREELQADLGVEIDGNSPAPDKLLEETWARTTLLELLGQLPALERAILIGHDIDEVPMQELADALGLPLSTSYKIRDRARAALLLLARDVQG